MPNSLILASQSTARAQLLRAAGFKFKVLPPKITEPKPAPRESPEHYLERLARLKATFAAQQFPEKIIVAADTALYLPAEENPLNPERFIGKPSGNTHAERTEQAVRILSKLVGQEHLIGTGVCVIGKTPPQGKRPVLAGYTSASLRLRKLTEQEIRKYVSAVKPWQYAGAYALQNGGSAIIDFIRGDPTTVIGLPISLTATLIALAL